MKTETTKKRKTVPASKTTVTKTAAVAKKKSAPSAPHPKKVSAKTKSAPAKKAPAKKKKKLRLKKSVKITMLAVCIISISCAVIPKALVSQSSASDKNIIEVELPDENVTEPETTTEPTTEEETLPDPNTPFIDYDMKIDPDKPMIALTFDDGPSPDGSSERIIDTLEKYGAHATFFVVGNNIDEDTKDLLRREIEIGCEIGNHSRAHEELTKLDLEEALESLHNCDEKVYQYTYRYPQLIRPPYGSYNNSIRESDPRMYIYWSIDTNDWKFRDGDIVYNLVMEYVDDGDIILMHDIHDETADAAERLIPDLLDMGYQLVTVSELMYYRQFKGEESLVLFNVHPDEPLYNSLYGNVLQRETEEPTEETTEESAYSEGTETEASEPAYT